MITMLLFVSNNEDHEKSSIISFSHFVLSPNFIITSITTKLQRVHTFRRQPKEIKLQAPLAKKSTPTLLLERTGQLQRKELQLSGRITVYQSQLYHCNPLQRKLKICYAMNVIRQSSKRLSPDSFFCRKKFMH